MDSFKKFIQKLKFSDLGTPFQVSQGEHSKPKVRKRFNLGTPFQVSQGEHSKPKKDVQEQLKIEDGKNAYEFFHDMHSLNPHIGPDDKIVQAKLEGHYNLYSNPHKHAIIKYTNGSYDLNTHLFEHHEKFKDPNHPVERYPELVDGLDKALAHKTLHTPLKVMSGLKKNPGLIMSDNKRIYHPAYMSTSIKPDIAHDFAETLHPGTNDTESLNYAHDRHILVSHLEPGQHGAYIGSKSSFEAEHEFLMPRRTIFQIKDHDVHKIEGTINKNEPVHVHFWHAHVINPDGKHSKS